ncbi:MAG: hypothetical protein ACE5IG_01195 [Dehalococcoidia bacterium]
MENDRIKSALERALEKAERLGTPSEAERQQWRDEPEGQRLANTYLQGREVVLAELESAQQQKRRYLVQGAMEVLVRSLDLPRNAHAKEVSQRALSGLKALKRDKKGVEQVVSRLQQVFQHYEQYGQQQRQQVYEELKRRFEAQVLQAAEQQMGPGARVNVNVEVLPEFQQEWRRVLGQLEASYLQHLEECQGILRGLE